MRYKDTSTLPNGGELFKFRNLSKKPFKLINAIVALDYKSRIILSPQYNISGNSFSKDLATFEDSDEIIANKEQIVKVTHYRSTHRKTGWEVNKIKEDVRDIMMRKTITSQSNIKQREGGSY